MELTADVCVIGGGPAGACAARRLAMLGHSVVVVEKARFPRGHVGESLHGDILSLLDVLDVRNAVENGRFLRPRSALIRWSGKTELRTFAGGPGFQVDRGCLDRILLHAAREAGARVLQPARLLQTGPELVVNSEDKSPVTVKSRFVIDASGRSSAFGGAKKLTGVRTMALFAYIRDVEWRGPETIVEAGLSAWFWGAPLPGGLFNATVFVDKDQFTNAGEVSDLYQRLLASSKLLSHCLRGKLESPVKVCDASCTACEEPIHGNTFRCGDSAFTIDPLSSQGVHMAIGSAIHAAAAIHTILRRPDDEVLARRFYTQRLRKSVRFHQNAAAHLYFDAAQVHRSDFWTRRARVEMESEPATIGAETRLQIHPDVRMEPVPILSGEFITSATGVTAPHMPEPLVFLGGVRLALLLQAIEAPMTAVEVVQFWSALIPPEQAIRILKFVVNKGILKPEKP